MAHHKKSAKKAAKKKDTGAAVAARSSSVSFPVYSPNLSMTVSSDPSSLPLHAS